MAFNYCWLVKIGFQFTNTTIMKKIHEVLMNKMHYPQFDKPKAGKWLSNKKGIHVHMDAL